MNRIKLNATPSTNGFLMDALSRKRNSPEYFALPSPTLVHTTNQSQGRGQRGNSWESQPGLNLQLSIYTSWENFPIANSFDLNRAVSLKIIEVLSNMNVPNLKIKWPNDIMSDGKKITGILIENRMRGKHVSESAIGVGINVNQTEFANLPKASSLKNILGKEVNIDKLLDALESGFEDLVAIVFSTRNEKLALEYRENQFGLGQEFVFVERDSILAKANKYAIEGTTSEGFLKLIDKQGEIRLAQMGELQMEF